jgi:hypothetical protein
MKQKKSIKAFTNALAPSKTTTKQLNALVKEVDAAILLVGPKNSVQRTHSWAKFGGKQSWPKIFIACLIRTGPRANTVTIDHNLAVALTTISIPSAMEIAACKTVDNFVNLAANTTTTMVAIARMTTPVNTTATTTMAAAIASTTTPPTVLTMIATTASATPTVPTTIAMTASATAIVVPANTTSAMTMCRTSQRGTIAATTAATANQAANPPNAATATAALTSQSIEVTSTFIPALFLCNAIFNEKSSNPLELIIIARKAAIEFDAHHCGAAGFANVSATVHANAFANRALSIHLGKLKEARFTINPDNNELQNFSLSKHAKCILPPLGAAGHITHGDVGAIGQSGHLDHEVFKSLGKGLKQMREAADKANVLNKKRSA